MGPPRSRQYDSGGGAGPAQDAMRSQPMIVAAIEKAFEAGGCVVCGVLRDWEYRTMFSFMYEGMSTPAAMEEFLEGGGFCARHFQLALRVSRESHLGLLGIAMLCSQLLPQAAINLEQTAAGPRKGPHLLRQRRDYPSPGEGCKFCRDARNAEEQVMAVLEHMAVADSTAKHLRSNGMCATHAGLAFITWNGESLRSWLAETVRRHIGGLLADVKEFQRKYDYRFSREAIGPEADIVARCAEFLLGPGSEIWRQTEPKR